MNSFLHFGGRLVIVIAEVDVVESLPCRQMQWRWGRRRFILSVGYQKATWKKKTETCAFHPRSPSSLLPRLQHRHHHLPCLLFSLPPQPSPNRSQDA